MATNKVPSKPAFIAYGEAKMQEALRADFKANIAKMGYPSKDEIGIVDSTQLTAANTLAAVPGVISSYMRDEARAFALPAPDEKTAPANLKLVDIDKKVSTGTMTFGPKKGESYETVVDAHTEFKVSSNRGDFKHNK